MTKKIFTFFFFGLLIGLCLHSCKPKLSADLVVMNAKVWTGSDSVFSEAIGIRKNKIIYVGTSDEAMKLSASTTRVIDAKGKLVIPGFNDAHIHFLSGSIGLTEVELSSAESVEEVCKRIREFAEKNPTLPWITGRGWQYTFFPGGMPTREFLDTLSIDRPIYISAYDGHSSLANSKALELAGITRESKFDGYGEIILDQSGEPTGVLTEHAESLIDRIVPPLSRNDKLNALRKGMQVAASFGITSIQNASGSIDEFSLYEELFENGELSLRSSTAFSVDEKTTDDNIELFKTTRDRIQKNHMVSAGAVKFMLDGVIESHTAAMLEQYSDAEGKGRLSMPVERYRQLVLSFDKAGFQIYTHAIGDLAVREAVNAYEFAQQTNSTSLA
ncbi:MAG: amidohydrolase, partial [Cyclobacteriaceae bacterium]|nr:amidohydrolase [Cyclobacteriaceae bacterium]